MLLLLPLRFPSSTPLVFYYNKLPLIFQEIIYYVSTVLFGFLRYLDSVLCKNSGWLIPMELSFWLPQVFFPIQPNSSPPINVPCHSGGVQLVLLMGDVPASNLRNNANVIISL